MTIQALDTKWKHPFRLTFRQFILGVLIFVISTLTISAVLTILNMSNARWDSIAQGVPAVALENARAMGIEAPVAKVSYEYDGKEYVKAATVSSTTLEGDTLTLSVDKTTLNPTLDYPDYSIALILVVGFGALCLITPCVLLIDRLT